MTLGINDSLMEKLFSKPIDHSHFPSTQSPSFAIKASPFSVIKNSMSYLSFKSLPSNHKSFQKAVFFPLHSLPLFLESPNHLFFSPYFSSSSSQIFFHQFEPLPFPCLDTLYHKLSFSTTQKIDIF